jgi:hypothetical protein
MTAFFHLRLWQAPPAQTNRYEATRVMRFESLVRFYARTYLLNQSIVRCHARSAAALL